MTDLREKVEEDRGLIKKIQLAIPGFRGYRQKEDLRIADRLLREQLADRMEAAARTTEKCRDKLAELQVLESMEKVRKLVNETNAASQRIRHAEQGYSGVSPDYRIQQSQLNRMYEWDVGLLDDVGGVNRAVEFVLEGISNGDMESVKRNIDLALKTLDNFNSIWNNRREAITGLLIGE